ncbi:L-proline amide hydrolase [Micromonospora auratinigra]|uniref:Proline iminopeptidase n=2 Tax=Micromonospora auratinigra TaxID=261654 RepID=A0A1A8ZIC0_9ACTN|nr:proline iminopeptidase-family hydrolase [Micromonospora auratinigra]SBT43785.1 L-proline amide hydrolase [Micromonospora auratinigra]
MTPAPTAKGTVEFGEHRTWYRVTGRLDEGTPPLVVLHGGPGSTHDYLLGLAGLSRTGRPVVHYDQLGNGGSTHLPGRGADFWTVELFLAELDNLLDRLGVAGDYVLFGQSWGGVLAAAHAAGRPAGLRGLVVANAPASYPLWLPELDRLRAALPPGVDATLRRHEAAGTTDSPAYTAAMMVFYQRHVCRRRPLPPELMATFMEINGDPTVYHSMNGPSEFCVTGTLRDYSLLDRLPLIDVPTLVLSGEHDEVTPAAVRPFHDLIPGARWEIVEGASHLPHLETPDRFDALLTEFLDKL